MHTKHTSEKKKCTKCHRSFIRHTAYKYFNRYPSGNLKPMCMKCEAGGPNYNYNAGKTYKENHIPQLSRIPWNKTEIKNFVEGEQYVGLTHLSI